MATRVLIAGRPGALAELRTADGEIAVVGVVRALDAAYKALRTLRPSVLVLDTGLIHRAGLCSLPALQRASPHTAIVVLPTAEPGPTLMRAIRIAARNAKPGRSEDGLTVRERDIVRLLALGHTNREIADRLVLSVRTIETHRARIQRRLGVGSRAELVRWALERGLLAP
jgi:two-component system response regulator NreC